MGLSLSGLLWEESGKEKGLEGLSMETVSPLAIYRKERPLSHCVTHKEIDLCKTQKFLLQ